MFNKNIPKNHPTLKTSYSSDLIAFIGTLFLWMFWPSFNAALGNFFLVFSLHLQSNIHRCRCGSISYGGEHSYSYGCVMFYDVCLVQDFTSQICNGLNSFFISNNFIFIYGVGGSSKCVTLRRSSDRSSGRYDYTRMGGYVYWLSGWHHFYIGLCFLIPILGKILWFIGMIEY